MKTKWKLIGGAVLALLVVAFYFLGGNKGKEVRVLEVQPASIAKTFTEKGEVVSEIQRPIYPVYGGKVLELPVEEAQRIKKGDLLMVIDSSELRFQREQLEADLKSIQGEEAKAQQEPYVSTVKGQQLQVEQARRDLQTAETNLKRANELYQAGIIPKSEYEAAQNTAEAAKNKLHQQEEALSLLYESQKLTNATKQYYEGRKEALRAQIDSLNYKIDNSQIVSPVEGIVSNLSVKKGQVIIPGSQVMNVFQEDAYEVEVLVLTEDVRHIEPGMKVNITQGAKNEGIRGEGIVKKLAPSAVETVSALGLAERRIKVTIKPAMPETVELRPGYAMDIEFTIAKQENKLVVPKTSLFPYAGGEAVWVARDGKAQVQAITKGFANDRDMVVEKGLAPGDLVIINPQLEGLQEGAKVIAVRVQ